MSVATLPPLPRLRLNSSGKPTIPEWVPPPETKLDLEWQPLRVLDLSLLDGDLEQQKTCEETCKKALMNEGFLLISNYGVEPKDVEDDFVYFSSWLMVRCNASSILQIG